MVTKSKDEIATELLNSIRSGEYKNKDRLPSEKELACKLQVTRVKVREALVKLEREGFVTRKQGIGTIINRHVLDVVNRMDMEKEFIEMVRDAGYKPDVKYSVFNENVHGCEDGTVTYERVITADKIPVILCRDTLNRNVVFNGEYRKGIDVSIFNFLKEYGFEVNTYLTDINAVEVNDELREKLELAENTSLLKLSETGYGKDGNPIIYSEIFYVNGYLKPTIIRKKI